MLLFSLLFLLIASLVDCQSYSSGGSITYSQASEYRSLDGSYVNVNNPTVGQAKTPFSRHFNEATSYMQPNNEPSNHSLLFPPRITSNSVFGKTSAPNGNNRGVSQFLSFWGVLVTFDTMLAQSNVTEPFDVQIPVDDPFFNPDPLATPVTSFPLWRHDYEVDENGVRQQLNYQSHYLDGSFIYGTTQQRSDALRNFTGGKLKVSINADGDSFPPWNDGNLTVSNPFPFLLPDSQLFLCGDPRCNMHPMVLVFITIFVREHNRWCDVLSTANPHWTDEILFQEARRRVIYLIQHVTLYEYSFALLGPRVDFLAPYSPTNSTIISNVAATAAFRYGHTDLRGINPRLQNDLTDASDGDDVFTRNSYFNPQLVFDLGVDEFLLGAFNTYARPATPYMVDDLRNFLFKFPFAPDVVAVQDLAATDIQRSSDHGLPSYNEMRVLYGLERLTNFSAITSNVALQFYLEETFGSVDNIDVFTGGLSEDASENSGIIGPLFSAIVIEMMNSFTAGDRFCLQPTNASYAFDSSELTDLELTKFANIIERNSNAVLPTNNAFYVNQTLGETSNSTSGSTVKTFQFFSGFYINFEMSTDKKSIDVTMVATVDFAWFAFGLSRYGGMVGSDAFIVQFDSDNMPYINDYTLGGMLLGPGGVCADTCYHGVDNLILLEAQYVNGVAVVKFQRLLDTGDLVDVPIVVGSPNTVVYATGSSNQPSVRYHQSKRGVATINFDSGVGALRFEGDAYTIRQMHGIFLSLAWDFCIWSGFLVVRYIPTKKSWRLPLHEFLQSQGALLSLASSVNIIFVRYASGQHDIKMTRHHYMGLVINGLSILQTATGACLISIFWKRHPLIKSYIPYFKIIHFTVGPSLLIISIAQVFLGFKLLRVSLNYRKIYVVYISLLITTTFLLEVHKAYYKYYRVGGKVKFFSKNESEFKETAASNSSNTTTINNSDKNKINAKARKQNSLNQMALVEIK